MEGNGMKFALKTLTLFIWAAACILAICWMAFSQIGSFQWNKFNWDMGFPGFNKAAVGDIVLLKDLTIAADGASELYVDTMYESIEFVYGKDSEIRVQHYAPSDLDETDQMALIREGDTIKAVRSNQRNWISFGINTWRSDARVVVYIPEDWTGSLDVNSASGNILLPMELSVPEMNLDSASGSITVESPITAYKKFVASAVSGKITLNDITSSHVEIESTSGNISLTHIESEEKIDISTISGTINLTGEAKAAQLSVSTTSGSAKISHVICEEYDGETISGSTTIETFVGGGSLESVSGSVKIDQLTLTGDLKLESISGSIKVALQETPGFRFDGSSVSGNYHGYWADKMKVRGHDERFTVGNGEFVLSTDTTSGSVTIDTF
jgi:DUF4097 and DUF4098 domain-containing protein YvlB